MNPRADGRTPVSDRETRQLLEALRSGKRAALARAISIVENDRPGAAEILQALHGETAKIHRIGITGPPGAGKSTLTAALIERLRRRGQTVGVVAAFAFVFALSYATFWVIKKTYGLRVTPEEEDAGLDISEHGMYGYPEQFIPAPELVGYAPAAAPVRPGRAPAPTTREVPA